ncbi:MAG: PKD domain-containing protein [Bacteroidia bacterium]
MFLQKTHIILVFVTVVLLSGLVYSQSTKVITPHVSPALKFSENLGQWDDNILFKAVLDGGAMFIERDGITYNLYNKKELRIDHLSAVRKEQKKNAAKIKGHVFKTEFLGCGIPRIEKALQGPDYENYFLGNDKTKWKSFVHNYHQVWLRNLYPNIDYEVITGINGIKYNFHVKPGGNTDVIQVQYKGVDNLKLKNNQLTIKLSIDEVIEHKPYAYQIINNKVVEVPCEFKLKDDVLTYHFPNSYNKRYELVIDPLLVFSAQIGVPADNFGMTATFDASGNLYSAGMVYAANYYTTAGSYDVSYNNPVGYGRTDVFITKYNATGNAIVYSTFLGGTGTEVASSLIVDKNNNICLYGATSSTDFPMLSNSAYPLFKGGTLIGFTSNGTIFCGGTDIYIAKVSANGSSLLASTYFGGTGNDGINYLTNTYNDFVSSAANPCTENFPSTFYDSLQTNYGDQFRGEIQIDASNNIYITSSTRSNDLPIVSGFDGTANGGQDALVAKFDANLSGLIFSSYIGGSQNDCGNGIYVAKNNEVYVTGGTCSNNLPFTGSGHTPTYQGGKSDGFLYRINAAGNGVLNGTYIGTNDYDNSFFVSGDKNEKIYVYGQSYGNMPIQAAPTATALFSVPNTHQFVRMYRKNIDQIYMSTVFGNKLSGVDISPSAFAVDNCNNIYLSGWGGGIITNTIAMNSMPIANAIPGFSTTNGYDFYLMALDSNATNLVFGSYFGGPTSQEHVDGGTSRFDPSGKIYQSVCAGCGGADDFPLSPNAWPCPSSTNCPNQNPSSNCNNGVFKIDFQLNLTVSSINTNTLSGCTPLTVSFTNVYTPTNTAATYTWNFGNGQTSTTSINPIYTYTTPGTYTVSLIIFDPSSCNKTDSSFTIIQVLPVPNTAFTASYSPCSNTVVTTNNSTGTLSTNPYTWDFGDASPTTTLTSPTHTYNSTGVYTITLNTTGANGCTNVATQTVSIFNFSPTVFGNTICAGAGASVVAAGGTNYTWTPSTGLSNPNIAMPAANPATTTVYTVTIENNSASPPCVAELTTTLVVNPRPNSQFTYTMNPCGGGVSFFDMSTGTVSVYNWTLSLTDTSHQQNPYIFYPAGGTHTVIQEVINQYGCTDTSAQVIIVPVPPPVSVSSQTTICIGNTAQLNASGGVSYLWSPAQSLNNPNIANPVASPTINTVYSVVITTSTGCQFTLNTLVIVSQLSSIPISAVANPTAVVKGNNTTLIYTGDPGASVSWFPNTFVTPKTGYTVNAIPDRPTTYTVLVNYGACRETLFVFVDVFIPGCEEGDAFVPNTFTPNGDGKNDILYVRGLKVEELYFAVYNRWGEMVFETTDKTKGWDGIYNGRPADVGVFGWYLKVKCYDGNETFKKGNVTLIR